MASHCVGSCWCRYRGSEERDAVGECRCALWSNWRWPSQEAAGRAYRMPCHASQLPPMDRASG